MCASSSDESSDLQDDLYSALQLNFSFLKKRECPIPPKVYKNLARDIEYQLIRKMDNPPKGLRINKILFGEMVTSRKSLMKWRATVSFNREFRESCIPSRIEHKQRMITEWFADVKVTVRTNATMRQKRGSILLLKKQGLWSFKDNEASRVQAETNLDLLDGDYIPKESRQKLYYNLIFLQSRMQKTNQKYGDLTNENEELKENNEELQEELRKMEIMEQQEQRDEINTLESELRSANLTITRLQNIIAQSRSNQQRRPCCNNFCEFKTLGLSHYANVEDVHSKYRQLSRNVHPDKNHDPNANDKFNQLVQTKDNVVQRINNWIGWA